MTVIPNHLLSKRRSLTYLSKINLAKKIAGLTFNQAKPTASLASGYDHIVLIQQMRHGSNDHQTDKRTKNENYKQL